MSSNIYKYTEIIMYRTKIFYIIIYDSIIMVGVFVCNA